MNGRTTEININDFLDADGNEIQSERFEDIDDQYVDQVLAENEALEANFEVQDALRDKSRL